MKTTSILLGLSLVATSALTASTISTSFGTADGFITGDAADVVLTDSTDASFTVTFSGGQQQQMFDAASYNSAPAAYLFVNTGPGAAVFAGGANGSTITGTTDVGTVSFSVGVAQLAFNAADRANGVPTFRLLDVAGALLSEVTITGDDNRVVADTAFSFTSADFGGSLIGSIEFDNAGPNMNAPYVIALDSFSASTVAVPEPSSALLAGLGIFLCAGRRTRK